MNSSVSKQLAVRYQSSQSLIVLMKSQLHCLIPLKSAVQAPDANLCYVGSNMKNCCQPNGAIEVLYMLPFVSVFVQEPKCSSTKLAIIYTEFPVICTKFLVISNSKLFPLDFPFSNLLSVILFPVFYTKFPVISYSKLKLFPLDFSLQSFTLGYFELQWNLLYKMSRLDARLWEEAAFKSSLRP